MTFLTPRGFALFALAAPLILLYVLKVRRARVRVGSTFLWRAAEADLLARHPFRRLKNEAALLLELLALAALAFALARPVTRGEELRGDHIAIVVDTSASMGAQEDGATRLERGVALARNRIAGLGALADAFVIEAAEAPRVVTERTHDGDALGRALEGLKARPVEGDLEAAFALAADRLRSFGGTGRILVVTDGALAHPVARGPEGIPFDVLAVGTGSENVAIVQASLQPDGTGRGNDVVAFAVLRNFGTRPRDVTVTATVVDGPGALPSMAPRDVAARRLLLEAGAELAVSLPFAARREDRGRGLRWTVTPGDALAADDVAFGRVPPSPRLPVVLATDAPSSWLARAFGADDGIDLRVVSVEQLARVNVEAEALVVVEGACPAQSPGAALLVVGPREGACEGLVVGPRSAPGAITSWSDDDGRLRYVTFDDVAIGRASALESRDGAATLVRAGTMPLVADASTPGRRVTVVGFDLNESTWPLTASFVVFLRNVVEETRAARATTGAVAGRPGEVVSVPVPDGTKDATLFGPDRERQTLPARGGAVIVLAPPRVGLYRVRWQEPRFGEALLALHLASAAESAIAPKPLRFEGAALGNATRAPEGHRELRGWLVALAMIALALDLLLLGAGPRRVAPKRAAPIVAAALASLPLLHEGAVRLGLLERPWLRFGAPAALLVVPIAAAVFVGLGQRALVTASPARRGWTVVATGLAVVLGLFVLAEPEASEPRLAVHGVLVFDRSRSIDLVPGAETRILAERRLAEASMGPDDRIATVVFGSEARVEEPSRPRTELPTPQRVEVGRDGSNVEAALRRALAEVPADVEGRIVLLSDGVATTGDAFAAAASALSADVVVDTVALEQRPVPNLRLASVRAPPQLQKGEALDLRVVIESPTATDVEVRVHRDGIATTTRRATVRAGEDVLLLREAPPPPGLHRYEVAVTALDPRADQAPEDNAASAFVRVAGPSLALVLAADTKAGAPLVAALRSAGFVVDARTGSGVPADAAELLGFDLVALGDIPASDLVPAQIDALARYARDLGGGLLLFGSDRSFGPGGYARTPLEDVSPVTFDLREDERRASLSEAIAIDASGSMGMVVSGQTKLALANEAAARSAALLGHRDRLAVAHVDEAVHWTVPMTPVDDGARIGGVIRAVAVGGGGIFTDLALKAGYEALRKETTNLKHMLLFADGDDAEQLAGCRALVSNAARDGITTSVISLGRGRDSTELEVLSRLGHGRFYLIDDATKLPAVFAQETVLAAKSALSDEPFRPIVTGPSPALRGLALDAAPALGGHVVTRSKGRAIIALASPEGDPVLATWSVGAGRVGVFTSDYESRWGKAWLAWPEAGRLFGQLARDLARRPDEDGVGLVAIAALGRITVEARGVGENGRPVPGQLVARIVGPDGAASEATLHAEGPGLFRGVVAVGRPGPYAIAVTDGSDGRVLASTGAELRAGEELRPTGSQRATLERLATMTGGTLRDTLAGLFADRRGRRRVFVPLAGPLLVAAALALLGSVAARRLVVPEVATAAFRRARRANLAPLAPPTGPPIGPIPNHRAEPPPPRAGDPPRTAPAAPAPPVAAPPDAPRPRTAAEILAERRRGKN